MKPAWDQLTKDFKDSEDVLIADVDCDGAGETLCQEMEITSYPTIRFGDPDKLDDYQGNRDLKSLQSFAFDMDPPCSPNNLDFCDPAKKKQLSKYMEMSKSDLEKEEAEMKGQLEEAYEEVNEIVPGLQSQLDEGRQVHDRKIEEVMNRGFIIMKAVAAHKKAAKGEL
mmetsp:Transcript_38299/g.86288  ORF Transcript_38299/g.86288 Transcript_38299/m.86288 type:complete len:168 (+) Transcript_38299:154-657(+)